ncbi:hypothetical protein MNQ95_11705 [Pseudoxanthomonas daejeonensis]|uniref:hypothetical protein n=1 Tax=Pseudoxanthomonas daejeonensis TaxID=266062 RepID=UPI001F543523|nr:hypothetical protein [Pseudoxanthomonas daejeonensis]UNK56807.1 hypothetical protein MNQ95_11705 [Pseudoxanthomonas daejeonensis]
MRRTKTMVTLLAAALGGCATGAGGLADVSPRPAERPECQVAPANQPAPEALLDSSAYQRCHPGDRLERSSGGSAPIRPGFGDRHDE